MRKLLTVLLGFGMFASLSVFGGSTAEKKALQEQNQADVEPHIRIIKEYSDDSDKNADSSVSGVDQHDIQAVNESLKIEHENSSHNRVEQTDSDLNKENIKNHNDAEPKMPNSCKTVAEEKAHPQHDMDRNVQ